jgi:hypothetical protein
MSPAPKHPDLMCRIIGLDYNFATKTARLYFPPYEFCDMAGAVKLVQAIDSEALQIHTFAGTRPDTRYRRHRVGLEWQATPAPVTPSP